MKLHGLKLMVVGLVAVFPGVAAANYPMLMAINPVAVQVGKTSECEIVARYNLHGAYKIFVTGTGVTGEVDPPAPVNPGGKLAAEKPNVEKLKVRFKVTPDALLGVRDVRIATPQGVSTLGQLVVVRDPVIREAPGDNNSMKTAQAITLPATVCGTIEKNEDVDFYKFKAEAGTALTFHVRCHRLAEKIHDLQTIADPIVILRNSAGTILASNDNFFAADPLLHYAFTKTGEYFLEIRDVRYGGDAYWNYSIEINDQPFVINVYPSRVTPGVPTRVRMVGFNLPADPTCTVTLPKDTPDGLAWALLPLSNGHASNAAPVIVSRLPEILESVGDHSTMEKAQSIPVPSGISGCIEKEGEIDCYAFEAKVGEKFTFEVIAQRHQSELDSILRIRNLKGELLAENDDYADGLGRVQGTGGVFPDSKIAGWAAPADGRFILEIRDVHRRGAPGFVYYLKVDKSQPHFQLDLDSDKTLLAPGIASVIFARVYREEGFEGEVQLAIDGLPPGVTATCGRILTNGTDGCILLKAAPDAAVGATNVRITGKANQVAKDGKRTELNVAARPLQEFYSPGGGRGRFPVEMHTVSVGEPMDLRGVKISPTALVLKPGESKKVEVTIDRSPGFKANVTLDTIYQHLSSVYGNSMPAGVTIDEKASQTLLIGDQVKGSIFLKAAPDAKPVKEQVIPIMAHVSINFAIKATYCGDPLLVTVSP
jgi:hypothetical protein